MDNRFELYRTKPCVISLSFAIFIAKINQCSRWVLWMAARRRKEIELSRQIIEKLKTFLLFVYLKS